MRHFLILLIIFITTSVLAQSAIAPLGEGTNDNPYQIASLGNLYWITADDDVVSTPNQAERWSSHYIQTADINAVETVNWFDGEGWSPIGFSDYPEPTHFSGTYNGQGNTINGLFINRPDSSRNGFFGSIQGASIENLGVIEADITGYSSNGGIVGLMTDSLVDNCYSSGNIAGESYSGGLAGFSQNSEIINSYSTADIQNNDLHAGGLVGFLYHTTVNNCYSTGNVNGGAIIGGLAGENFCSVIDNSYSTGNVDGEGCAGGLVGFHQNSTISNSHSTGNVSSPSQLGGLVGMLSADPLITNSYYNYEQVLLNNEHLVTPGALDNDTFISWIDNDLTLVIDEHLTYDGETYLINSAGDFKKLLAFGQYPEYAFTLTGNLDFSEHPGLYIPLFFGEFDGNGYSIDNLTINLDWNDYLGLFGRVSGGVIRNLGVTNISISGRFQVGGLAGYQNDSSLYHCSATGEINGIAFVGGMVGRQSDSSIEYSYTICDVYGYYDELASAAVGGMVGSQSNSVITQSYSSGSVFGYCEYGGIGGLVGYQYNDSLISNSFSTASVFGDYSGGLVGYSHSSSIIHCFATGEGNVHGGLVGYAVTTITDIGNYWDEEISDQSYSAMGEGRTTAEMTFPYADNTYSEWDFENIWSADENYEVNSGYPYLREIPLSVEDRDEVIPKRYYLSNYPNPFNPETTISYNLQDDVEIMELKIYNVLGQAVRTLVPAAPHPNGEYSVIWDGKNDLGRPVASGIYFYRMRTPDFDGIRKMMLLK